MIAHSQRNCDAADEGDADIATLQVALSLRGLRLGLFSSPWGFAGSGVVNVATSTVCRALMTTTAWATFAAKPSTAPGPRNRALCRGEVPA